MWFSSREFWTIIHGMVLGGLLLLAFSGVLVGLWSLRHNWVNETDLKKHVRILTWAICGLTILAWLTVISGTYLPYPWFRASPGGQADLSHFPQAFLLSNPRLAFWEDYGMEWKEHLAWFAPILMTTVSFIVIRYGSRIAAERRILKALVVFLIIAFAASGIAGLVGAFVTKVAAVR
jgi:hypothetical protein